MVEALKKRKHKVSGLSFPRAAYGEIKNAVHKEAIRRRAQREGGNEVTPPTDKNIREALETFSKQEWRSLIARFGEQDLKPLRSYLDTRRDELELSDRARFQVVFGSAVKRATFLRALLLRKAGVRWTPVMDPMWALIFRGFARKLKMEGEPRPSKKRTADEMGGCRAIAEGLSEGGRNVNDKQIATYFKRMERIPFDQFDGSAYDYFAMIANTQAYKRYLRSQQVD